MTGDSASRFTGRVADYVRTRPSYPAAVVDLLRRHCGLGRDAVVADIGSGTGILTSLLLPEAGTVYAVEPNAAMREAAVSFLGDHPGLRHVAATAEATTLKESSIDLVVAAQAFHWFDRAAVHHEWTRLLKPGGWLALIWNDRRIGTTPFLRDYEALLQTFGTDYNRVNHRNIKDTDLAAFFAPAPMHTAVFENAQQLDLDGLRGRLQSSSYTPPAGHPRTPEMLAQLARIFHRHAVDDRITMLYDCRLYYGQLSAG